jgi:glycosyltransferase involved in cell wall biosynthesis
MVSVVINYCNNDFQFIEENIMQAKKISSDITIVYCKKSLDGKDEDIHILEKMKTIATEHRCYVDEIYFQENQSPRYHHNLMREQGAISSYMEDRTDYILFLDADEIIEGDKMRQYLESGEYKNFDVVAFECYWYFRERKCRADQTEQAAVLCKKDICKVDYIFSEAERWEFLNRPHLKVSQHTKHNGEVLVHHYSWVRTKEQMLNKVRSWGHKSDRNWVAEVEQEFSHDFNGTDFVHHYTYSHT